MGRTSIRATLSKLLNITMSTLAFDRINHWCLFKKLIERNIIVIRLLIFWYCNQSFCVRWGNTISNYFTVSNGVRQGGILSPFLFNIYMDDLSKILNDSHSGCSMNGTTINHLMYADDTCIIAPSPSALQDLLDICENFALNNFIVFNEKKTKCMCFKPKSLKCLYVPNMYLNNIPLNIVSTNKYLGIFIQDKREDDDDIMRHVKSLYTRGNILINRFRACSFDVKIQLFRSFLCNAYGCQLWSKYKQCTYKRAVVAYNNIFRKLFGIQRGESMSAIYVFNNIDSFRILVRKNVYGFRARVNDSENELISCMTSSLFNYHSRVTDRWSKILYLHN